MGARQRRARAAAWTAWSLGTAAVLSAPAGLAQTASPTSMRSRFGVSLWIARAAHPDPAVRRSSVNTLAAYTPVDPAMRAAVVAALSARLVPEQVPEVQEAIVEAIFALDADRERAVSVVRSALLSRGVLRGAAARRAYERIGPSLDRAGIDEVLQVLSRGSLDPPLRTAALAALAAAPGPVFAERIAGSISSRSLAIMLEAIAVRGDGRWGAIVLEQLGASSAEVQLGALRAAAGLRLLEAARPIARIAGTSNVEAVRVAALEALAVVGSGHREATRAALEQSLRAAESAAVVTAARGAAAALGLRALASVVAGRLDAAWAVERREVAETLGALGGPEAFAALMNALRSESDPSVQRALWRAAVMADEEACRAALDRAEDGSAVWIALELGMRSGEFPRTARLTERAVRGEPGPMALACARGACGPALSELSAADGARRASGAWALTWSGEASAVGPLCASLARERDPAARRGMLLALGRRSSADSTACLERAMRAAEGGIELALTADLLARRGALSARERLPELLEDLRPSLRSLAVEIAWRTQDPPGLSRARRLAWDDPSADVRRIAGLRTRGLGSDLDEARSARGREALHGIGLRGHASFAVWLADGSVVLAMSARDGTLLVPGVPAGSFDVEPLDG